MPDPRRAPIAPRIGTAGWSIPSSAMESFPGGGSHLERYAAILPCAEINSSFHRPHRRTTYGRWAASVPADFRFSVKIPKTITHLARLVDCGALLDTFLEQAGGLGNKLEALLLQLPPSFAFDRGVVGAFLAELSPRLPPAITVACEPRHATWFAADVDDWLADQRIARVAADPVIAPGGEAPGGWPGLRYHRLHGAPRIYYSSYDATRIETLSQSLGAACRAGERCWCIFDNTASGAATGDALALRAALQAANRA